MSCMNDGMLLRLAGGSPQLHTLDLSGCYQPGLTPQVCASCLLICFFMLHMCVASCLWCTSVCRGGGVATHRKTAFAQARWSNNFLWLAMATRACR